MIQRLNATRLSFALIGLIAISPMLMQTARAEDEDEINLPQEASPNGEEETLASLPEPEVESQRGYQLFPNNGWNVSIMFGVSDMRRLKDVFETIESRYENTPGAIAAGGMPAELPGNDGKAVPRNYAAPDDGTDAPQAENAGSAEGQESDYASVSDSYESQNEAGVFHSRSGDLTLYLNSIIYKSPDEWTVWVNGTRFTHDNPPSSFDIARVTDKAVQFRWPGQGGRLEGLRNRPALRKDARNNDLLVTLYPNQSFVGDVIEIIEGKAMTLTLVRPNAPAKESEEEQETTESTEEKPSSEGKTPSLEPNQTAEADTLMDEAGEAANTAMDKAKQAFEDQLDAARRAIESYSGDGS